VRWDFGDGSFATTLTAVHHYKWPGEYKVRLSIYDKTGNSYDSSFKPVIQIYDFIADQLQFREYRNFIYDVPASKIGEPVIIDRHNSWQSYNALSAVGYTINLYASGACGDYQNIENFYDDKWSHLRVLSRFYQKTKVGTGYEYKSIDKVTTTTTELYVRVNENKELVACSPTDPGAVLAGTTGSAEFFYVDDRVKNFTSLTPPTFLFATFESSKFQDAFTINNNAFESVEYPPYGFQNMKPTVMPIIKVRHNPAKFLSISTCGIDGEGMLSSTKFDIPNISWQNTEIPFVIKMKDKDSFTTKTYPPIIRAASGEPLNNGKLHIGIVQKDNNTGRITPVTAVSVYDDFSPDIPQSTGAFYKGYFVAKEPTLNCVLTAQMFLADPPNFPKDSFVAWIAAPQYNMLLRFFKQQAYTMCPGVLTMTMSSDHRYFESEKNRNVYAIQVAPSGRIVGTDYDSWFADGSSNTIFQFDINGRIKKKIPLKNAPVVDQRGNVRYCNLLSPVLSSAAPGSIALDGRGDVWVALFDSVSCIKIDSETGYITAVAYPPTNNFVYNLSADYNIKALHGFAGENLLLPSSLDTDYNSNVWVTYTNPASNFLVKYNTNGQVLKVVPMQPYHSPAEVCIDRNKFVWVTTYNLTTNSSTFGSRNDFIYKFTQNGDLVPGFPIAGFRLIGNITIDGAQNAWVNHDRDTLTRISGVDGTKTNYFAGSGNETTYIGSIDGIAADTDGTIWVINSWNKKMYFVDTFSPPVTSLNDLLSYSLTYPEGDDVTYPLSSFEEKRFQAYGDWTGARWINKYIDPETTIRTVTGVSSEFNIYPVSGYYNMSKVNEDFDAESFYKSLIYTENLETKKVFFEDFLGTIVGDSKAMPYELGKTIYEKIANFTSNTSDIDTCNLDQLLSFCQELSIQFEQYNYPFPPQLSRLVNILSIKHKKLWGESNRYNNVINQAKQFANAKEISTKTGIISCGYPIIAQDLFSEIYTIVNTQIIPGYAFGAKMPLSGFSYDWGWGLVASNTVSGVKISDFYKFYTYNPITDSNHYGNIINWNDPYTTLSYTESSFNTWQKDNGLMQNMLSYELTKGLRLFLSGSDIIYNN